MLHRSLPAFVMVPDDHYWFRGIPPALSGHTCEGDPCMFIYYTHTLGMRQPSAVPACSSRDIGETWTVPIVRTSAWVPESGLHLTLYKFYLYQASGPELRLAGLYRYLCPLTAIIQKIPSVCLLVGDMKYFMA
ncbi:hypothetical protein CMEL01_01211 [Colletotrichum melonis]|uniref:Uncharacterized protein n=1 Tax=Colletotrichum melonis TaxID=1209925 RepID=A0AAI9V640_9PEZI|nr:hypothetical protein CMEL01_01211 [Colletotrichum melonis]